MKKAVCISCSDHYDHRLRIAASCLRSRGYEISYITSDFDHTTKVKFTCSVENCIQLPARPEGIFSVFALGETARGVTILGGRYPLEDGELSPYFPLGVSNHFEGRPVEISVERGCLLAGWEFS